MKRKVKFHAQAKLEEKKNGAKTSAHSPKTAAAYQAGPMPNGFRELSPTTAPMLQRALGNRAVTEMIARRQGEEEELNYPGPRGGRQAETEEELDYPGPRSGREAQEDSLDYPGLQTGLETVSGGPRAGGGAAPKVGDAIDLDGKGLYGWNRVITARDVATVVNGVIKARKLGKSKSKNVFKFLKGMMSPLNIVILSGTHGNTKGHLVNDAASRNFVGEDQATALKANAVPGVKTHVVDVVTSYSKRSDLLKAYKTPNYVRILGWCYSSRSHGLGKKIKSNWWKGKARL